MYWRQFAEALIGFVITLMYTHLEQWESTNISLAHEANAGAAIEFTHRTILSQKRKHRNLVAQGLGIAKA